MTHELKCLKPYFQHILDGQKTFELRKDDRGYRVGDVLRLVETTSAYQEPTGRVAAVRVTYLLTGPWLAKDHVALGIKLEEPKP